MGLVYMGSPEFSLPTLEGLVKAGYDIVGIYTRPDRPSGRGRALTPPPGIYEMGSSSWQRQGERSRASGMIVRRGDEGRGGSKRGG